MLPVTLMYARGVLNAFGVKFSTHAAPTATQAASLPFGLRVVVLSMKSVMPTRSACVSLGGTNPAAGVTCAEAPVARNTIAAVEARVRRKETSLAHCDNPSVSMCRQQ